MTAATEIKQYACKHCGETFTSPVKLGGHVHAQHPEHRRPLPKFLQTVSTPAPLRGSSLERSTDTWPGKP